MEFTVDDGYIVGYRLENGVNIPHAWFAPTSAGRAKRFAQDLAKWTDRGKFRVYMLRMRDGKKLVWTRSIWEDGWT